MIAITSAELDNICWNCEPVIELIEQEVDNTEPTGIIKALGVKAIAYTQGLNSGMSEWDGTLEFIDTMYNLPIPSVSVYKFSDSIDVSTQIPTQSSFTEVVNNIKIKPILIYTGDNGYSWGELKSDSWLNLKAKTWNTLKEGD